MSIAQNWLGQHDTNLWGGTGAGSGLGVGGVTNMRSMGPSAMHRQKQWYDYPQQQAAAQVQERPTVSPLMKAIGGQSGYSPITQGPVYTRKEMDQGTNDIFSQGAKRTESNIRQMQEGRGASNFGGLGSAAQQEMAMNARGRNLGNSVGAAREFQTGMAQKNADMVTQREGLRLGQQQAANQDDIARRRMQQVGTTLTPGTYQPRGGGALSQALYNQKPQERQLSQNMGGLSGMWS